MSRCPAVFLTDRERLLQRAVRCRERPAAGPGRVHSPSPRLPRTFLEARERLRDPLTVASLPFRQAAVEEMDFDGCDPHLVEFTRAFVLELHRFAIPVVVSEMLRTRDVQEYRFQIGLSPFPSAFSPHCVGRAVDVIHYSRGFDLLNREWSVIAALAADVARRREIPISWGGQSSLYRPGHFELQC